MQSIKVAAVVALYVVIALLGGGLAKASHYEIRYESKGNVSLSLVDIPGGEKLVFNILPTTGDYSPGPVVVRLDGQPVWQSDGSEYWGSVAIPYQGQIQVLDGNKLFCDLKQPNAAAITTSADWFLLEHQVEVYFTASNGKGKQDRNHSAAPATQFHFENVSPSAGTPETFTVDQLKAAIAESYKKGVSDSQASFASDRTRMAEQIKGLMGDNNALREQLARRPSATPAPAQAATPQFVKGYLPVQLDSGEAMPAVDDLFVLTRNGREVSRLRVVVVNITYNGFRHYLVVGDLPLDALSGGYSVWPLKGYYSR